VGATSMLLSYAKMKSGEEKGFETRGWLEHEKERKLLKGINFDVAIPLSHIMNIFKDHTAPIMKAKQQLILIRSRDDKNCFKKHWLQKMTYQKLHF
jgi:hypothetical protein